MMAAISRLESQIKPNDRAGRLQREYVLALGLVACLTLSTQLLLDRALTLQKSETALLQLTDEEKLLSQHVAKGALAFVADMDIERTEKWRANLLDTLGQWQKSNETLGSHLSWLAGTAASWPQMQARLVSANKHYRTVERAATQLVDNHRAASQPTRADTRRLIQTILAAENQFVEDMDAVANAFAQEAQLRKERLKQAGVSVVVITLILLVLQAWSVFGHAWAMRRAVVDSERGAEQVIERMSRQTELILNAAGEGIWGVDQHGRTTFVNPAAARMAGWDVDELIGTSQHNVLRHSGPDGVEYEPDCCPICRAF